MYENFTVKGDPLKLSTNADVDAAEAKLGIRFPTGYREYVTRFGMGVLGGMFVFIYPPREILLGYNRVSKWRRGTREYWFWDESPEIMTKERALECVRIGDTTNGDQIIVHPDDSERIYVLPRNDEKIFIAGDGLPGAIEWMCSSGVLREAFTERDFQP